LWNEIHFAAATFFIFVIFTNKNQGENERKKSYRNLVYLSTSAQMEERKMEEEKQLSK